MDEIIERYNQAVEAYSQVWEQRVRSYNDRVAIAILESWKDVKGLIEKLTEERN